MANLNVNPEYDIDMNSSHQRQELMQIDLMRDMGSYSEMMHF